MEFVEHRGGSKGEARTAQVWINSLGELRSFGIIGGKF